MISMAESEKDSLFAALGGMTIDSIEERQGIARLMFNVLPQFCHSGGRIAQGGFITAWMDAAMAHAVMHHTGMRQNIASLEIKVSFLERVGPGRVLAEGRVLRMGRRVAFLEGSLFSEDGRRTLATSTSTGLLIPLDPAA